MALLQYANNGGCSCGCGVSCEDPFQRWNCPHDVGYACSRTLSPQNPPFFGDPERTAPCTVQSRAVVTALVIFTCFIPAVSHFATALALCSPPLNKGVHVQIQQQIVARKQGKRAYDPVRIALLDDTEQRQKVEVGTRGQLAYFTCHEMSTLLGAEANAPMRMERSLIFISSVWAILIVVLLLSAFISYGSPFFTLLASISSMLVTAFVALLYVSCSRLLVLQALLPAIQKFHSRQNFDKQHGCHDVLHVSGCVVGATLLVLPLKRWVARAKRSLEAPDRPPGRIEDKASHRGARRATRQNRRQST
mmetsp:Transcript_52498/g.104343  ORF Transcript_52498/g.104343 Transcript_52498/m.104343 type:complete len:306 (-) Transcript_52498:185-1102(-)